MIPKDMLKPVAVVGIAAELPSGEYSTENFNHETFFQFLLDKGQAYQKVPSDRFNAQSWRGRGLGQIVTDTGAFLKDISLFDHVEFGVSAKDARSMSLSTRKLIELSFLALLDSGIHYRGQQVGCYMSGIPFDILTVADPDEFEARGSFAGGACMIANRVSYHLDLLGPSIPIDTACSSTLVALHLAVQALRVGDCKAAVVGGCQLNHRFIDFIQYSQGGVLAPDGKCKPFDASANGFARSEGAVVIVVKLLEDAIREGDHVYATILGTAVTTNGSAAPVNAPVAEAQAQAMEKAYIGTGRNPKDVDFVELHATGTAAGDPIEANWAGMKFHRDDELLVGSVKGNIGHLETTAFLASLSKVCSMFSSGVIPPNVNLTTPNPAIKWNEFNMHAPTTQTPLPTHQSSGQYLVSMMSSGIGGVNGHAVVESPAPMQKPRKHRETLTLHISAGLSPRSSLAVSSSLLEKASDPNTDLPLLSTLFGRRARQMNWRSFAIIRPDHSIAFSFEQPIFSQRASRPLAFVFSGQGTQYFEMGKQLFRDIPRFRSSVLQLDSVYRRITGTSLIETTGLFWNQSTLSASLPSIWPIAITLPALCMIQIALCDALKEIGVVPDILIGHSAGETPLLYASGAATAEMTMELAIARGQAMTITEKVGGSMAALNCAVHHAHKIIQQVLSGSPGTLEIACFNSHDSVTVAGDEPCIDRLVTLAQAQGLFCRKLRTHVAVHSSLMESCHDLHDSLVSDVFLRHPSIPIPQKPVYSSYTGCLYDENFSAEYFWSQTRHPVRFVDALSRLINDNPNTVFLEIGPHPALATYVGGACGNPNSVLCPMKRPKTKSSYHEIQTYLGSIGRLVVLGYNSVDFCALNDCKFAPHLPALDAYPFAKKHIPYQPESSAILTRQLAVRNGPLNHPFLRLNVSTHPTIAQHVIRDEPIMPAAGYLEMAFEFGATLLWNVSFHSMMSIPTDKVINVDVVGEGCYWSIKSRSSPTSSTSRLHADGYMSKEEIRISLPSLDIADIQARCRPFSTRRFYTTLTYFANYGPIFQRVTACWKGADEALVQVRGADDDLPDLAEYILHPAVLDACLHVMVHPSFTGNTDRNTYYLPSRVNSVRNHVSESRKGALPKILFAHAVFRHWRPDGIVFDITVVDSEGRRLCTMNGFEVGAHEAYPAAPIGARYDMTYQQYGLDPILDVLAGQIVPPSEFNSNGHPEIDTGDPIEPATLAPWKHSLCLNNPCCRLCTIHQIGDVVEVFQELYNNAKMVKRSIRVFDFIRDPQLSQKLREISSNDSYAYCAYDILLSPTELKTVQDLGIYTRIMSSPDTSLPLKELSPSAYDIVIGHGISGELDAGPFVDSVFSLLVPGGVCVLRTPTLTEQSQLPQLNCSKKPHHTCGSAVDCFNCLDQTSRAHISFAQKRSLRLLPDQSLNGPHPLALEFSRETVLQLKSSISGLNEGDQLWLHASFDTNAEAASGFVRSIRREVENRIRLALFAENWSSEQRLSMIEQLSRFNTIEDEFVIDRHGTISVQRLIPRPDPLHTFVSENDYWCTTASGILYKSLPSPEVGHVLVHVTLIREIMDGIYAIAGEIVDQNQTSWSIAQQVVGVSLSPLSNYCVEPEGNFTTLPTDVSQKAFLEMLGSLLVLASAVGTNSLCLERLQRRRILITNDDIAIGKGVIKILLSLGLSVARLSNYISPQDFSTVSSSDFVLSGFQDGNRRVLQSLLPKNASTYFWNDSCQGLRRTLSHNPWMVFDSIRSLAERFVAVLNCADENALHPSSLIPQNMSTIHDRLFESNKVYLLIGGIGSLGLHISLWMYKKGARKIVLTSRSGRESLTRPNKLIALRILDYLESLPDFDLQLKACDASSSTTTAKLVSEIDGTISGVMLLSVQLSDRIFTSQTESTWNMPFVTKEGAFLALKDCVEIEKLDFLISMSSATIFGSAGQTNYASANCVLDGLLRDLPNAFSLVAPAITDSSAIARTEDLLTDVRLAHWAPWAMSSKEICACLEDGIKMLKHSPFWLYVPEYKWLEMQTHFGSSPIYDHLVRRPYEGDDGTDKKDARKIASLEEFVLKLLDVDLADFDHSVPFTAYGLDSLSAGRLSAALRPIVSLTQLQLLAEMSYDDVCKKIEGQNGEAE